MNKFKVGDLVRVSLPKNERLMFWGSQVNGKIYRVNYVYNSGNVYKLEDGKGFIYYESWLKPVEAVQIVIDPRDPKSAHAAVSKACKEWKDKQRDWTEEEIKEAKRLSDEMVLELFHAGKSPMFSYSGCGNTVSFVLMKFGMWLGAYGEAYCAKVRGKNIPNLDIGKCVCLCKATGREIPDFILRKNR